MKEIKKLSTDVPFPALKLHRKRGGTIAYDIAAMRRICEQNNIDAEAVLNDEENASEMIMVIYAAWRVAGGDPDPTMETILAEVFAEDQHGIGNVQSGGGIQ